MTKTVTIAGGLIVCVLISLMLVPNLAAQTRKGDSAAATKKEKAIPEAALLTERGRQLAKELRMLRKARDSMGSKHPTLPLVKDKIEAIEEQLEAWEPAFGDPPENPFHPNDDSAPSPQMNEYDLRQIVIRLTKRVEALEKRVTQLENQTQ